ncbi:alpha/beta hydrolase [Rhypophila decipiens]
MPSSKAAPPTLPTVAETLKHPAFPTATWNLEADRSGLTPVAEGRGGSLKISWEIHGEGPIKIILIMGLAGFKSAWQRQTMHFGHERRDQYSVLVCDNRGMGDSDKPLMRYSSSEMARDLIEVMSHVGWLPPDALSPSAQLARSINVVGISMGGMIAQEIACLIPDAISSLNLLCTAAAIENTTTYVENMSNRASMLIPKSVERSVRDAALQIFNHDWLIQPDDARLPDPKTTPKCHTPSAGEYLHFDTNAQRFIAQEMHKRLDSARFGLKGFLLQLIAAGWHHKSPAQLKEMADRVGRDRILVLHGVDDNMISLPHGKKLIEYIQPAVGIIQEGLGHAPIAEKCDWLNGLLEERFAAGEKLNRDASS